MVIFGFFMSKFYLIRDLINESISNLSIGDKNDNISDFAVEKYMRILEFADMDKRHYIIQRYNIVMPNDIRKKLLLVLKEYFDLEKIEKTQYHNGYIAIPCGCRSGTGLRASDFSRWLVDTLVVNSCIFGVENTINKLCDFISTNSMNTETFYCVNLKTYYKYNNSFSFDGVKVSLCERRITYDKIHDNYNHEDSSLFPCGMCSENMEVQDMIFQVTEKHYPAFSSNSTCDICRKNKFDIDEFLSCFSFIHNIKISAKFIFTIISENEFFNVLSYGEFDYDWHAIRSDCLYIEKIDFQKSIDFYKKILSLNSPGREKIFESMNLYNNFSRNRFDAEHKNTIINSCRIFELLLSDIDNIEKNGNLLIDESEKNAIYDTKKERWESIQIVIDKIYTHNDIVDTINNTPGNISSCSISDIDEQAIEKLFIRRNKIMHGINISIRDFSDVRKTVSSVIRTLIDDIVNANLIMSWNGLSDKEIERMKKKEFKWLLMSDPNYKNKSKKEMEQIVEKYFQRI